MINYVIVRISDILGNPICNRINFTDYQTIEKAKDELPSNNEQGQCLVVLRETNENEVIVRSEIVYAQIT